MALDKFLTMDPAGASNHFPEKAPAQSSGGTADAGRIVALNSAGQVDSTMLPGTNTATMTASEAIAAGSLVNIWTSASNPTGPAIRLADNTSTAKKALGFVTSAIASGASGTVTLREGLVTGLSGLTAGTAYWLGTGGAPTPTMPTASGSLAQYLGVAKSATELNFVEHVAVVRA